MPQRGQLSEQAYQTVKHRLLNGVYKAGDRISVEGLTSELGTSRQPIMDALKRLATGYYIEIIPQVGVRVVDTKRQDFIDFLRSLAATESVAAELAAARADRSGAAILADINLRMKKLPSESIDDEEFESRYRILNREFHRHLNALANSANINSIGAYMWDRADFFVASSLSIRVSRKRAVETYEEHNAIYEAIAANDPQAAHDAMEAHVMAFSRNVERGSGTESN